MSHLFSPLSFGGLTVKNRTVRSATADAEVYNDNRVLPVTLERYRRLAEGGVGMIITGDFTVIDAAMMEASARDMNAFSFEEVRISGMEDIAETVHRAQRDVKIIAQLAPGYIMRLPSLYASPFGDLGMKVFTREEIRALVKSFAVAARSCAEAGFDGVQIHAAHGGPLSLFLSPLTNTRDDTYGDGAEIFREIRDGIHEVCGDYPVLIKMNCTDYMPGGLDRERFHRLAGEIAAAGYDAVEVSGGIWDCLYRSEEELGFPPRPSAEAHTNLGQVKSQSYFRPFVRGLDLPVPLILAGGNFTRSLCEDIISSGDADMVSFCRPLIREPDMVRKWADGRTEKASCNACNACLYELYEHPGSENFLPVRCVFREDKKRYAEGLAWGKNWARNNFPDGPGRSP